MNRSKWIRAGAVSLVAAGAAAVVMVSSPVAVVAQSAVPGPLVTNNVSPAAALAAASEWTPARMAAAVPYDVVLDGVPAPSTAPAPAATGVPTVAGSMVPGGAVNPTRTFASAAAAAAEGPLPADGAYPGPHATYYYGPKYTTYPISTAGKLFFTPAGGGSAWCSANVTVGSSGVLDKIWTAGHCISDGAGSFHSGWIFCPSYNASGINPARGCWRGDGFAVVYTTWHTTNNWRYDYGLIGLETCSVGVAYCVVNGEVASYTGGTGLAWNFGRDQHWHHFGYPNDSWNGNSLVYTTTEHRYDDTAGGAGPLTNSWGSAQTPGASGSNLLLGFSYGSAYTNSDVSYYYGSQYGFELQGPYFDTSACTLWKTYTGFTGTC